MTSRIVATVAALLVSTAAASTAWAIPAAPTFVVVSDAKVIEGNGGMTMFTVQVSAMYSQTPIEADITAMPGTASDADFSFSPVHLALAPGTVQDVTGFIIGDREFEELETFTVTATVTGMFMGNRGKPGTVVIVDDDQDAAPYLRAESATVPEGSAGWHTVPVRVQVDPAVAHAVEVGYQTRGGVPYGALGTLWGDYRSASGMLTFAPGETSKTIAIEVNGDTAWEPDTRVSVELMAPRGGLLGMTPAEIVLANDDAPTVTTIDDMQVTEGQAGRRAVSVRLRFDPPTPPLAKVHVNLVGGSARAGDDFVGGSQDLYPAPGSTSMTFELDVLSDTTPECDEGILIEYQGLYTGDDTQKVARALILDDDGGPKDGGTCPDPFLTRTPPLETDGGVQPGADGGAADLPPGTGTPTDGAAEKPATPPDRGCAVASDPASPTSLVTALALIAAFRTARRRR